MSQHYSALEQMIIDQELSNLSNHLTIQLEELHEYLSELQTLGFCKEIEDFNAFFFEEGTNNRFRLELSLVNVTMEDESFTNELQESISKMKKSRQPYYARQVKDWHFLFGIGFNQIDIMSYQKILLKHFERLLTEKLIKKFTFQVLIRGPILYRVEEKPTNSDYDYFDDQEDEYYDESMSELLAHPFTKLQRMRMSNEEKPLKSEILTFSPDFDPEELLNKIQQELKEITIVQGDKILFTIDGEIFTLFKRWTADRQTQDNISQLYPLLTSVHFLTQLQEWTELGKQIINETALLNNQIQLLTKNSAFDIQTIEMILKEAWTKEEKEILTREEVLDRWATFLQERGDARSHDYLKKNILRPRLKMAIEKIKQNNELETYTFDVFKELTEKSGKPATMFKLK